MNGETDGTVRESFIDFQHLYVSGTPTTVNVYKIVNSLVVLL